MNKIFLIGNLTRDPELTEINSGAKVCRFSIAVNRRWANADGEREVDFFNIVAWRTTGENCAKFLSKGKKVAIEGRVEIRNYEDKEGNKRIAVDVVADEVEFLSARGESGNSESSGEDRPSYKAATGKAESKPKLEPVEDDDLPF